MNVRMVPPMVMPNNWRLGHRIGCRLNSEGTAYSANDAADHAANDATYRSCCLGPHIGAMRRAVRDALCLRRKRASK